MNLKKTISLLAVAALGLATVSGIAIYRTASAAAIQESSESQVDSGQAEMVSPGGPRGSFTDEDLAAALGISTDELNAAYQEANEAALKQAVEEGLIAQAQADEILSEGRAFHFDRRWKSPLGDIDYQALLAESLGISVEKLQQAYSTAYYAHIDQAVVDGSLTEEQADLKKGRYALYNNETFQTAMQSAFEAALDQAVADGVISQEQAEQILEAGDQPAFPSSHGFNGPDGPGGGRSHRDSNQPPAGNGKPATPSTPAATPTSSGM